MFWVAWLKKPQTGTQPGWGKGTGGQVIRKLESIFRGAKVSLKVRI